MPTADSRTRNESMDETTTSPPRNPGVLEVQRQKKQAELDATLLANRILMLDNEQAKMLKKIEKTRR